MKYKKSIFAILTLLFLQFCCYPLSWSFPNEPSGFHGVPCGSRINHGPEMSKGHAFEICLDREDSRKIVWWTSNEKDARWLVKKLSEFLKMEWVDNA